MGDVTMRTEVCSLMYVYNAAGTVLINYAKKVGDLVLFGTPCILE
jgi:hypothetical protein